MNVAPREVHEYEPRPELVRAIPWLMDNIDEIRDAFDYFIIDEWSGYVRALDSDGDCRFILGPGQWVVETTYGAGDRLGGNYECLSVKEFEKRYQRVKVACDE